MLVAASTRTPSPGGAALVRGLVRRAARGRMPLTRSGNLPQGRVIALEVCLA